jgi:hypothetical protein
MPQSSSGFSELDTEIHRMVASLLKNHVLLKNAWGRPMAQFHRFNG